VRPAGVTVIAIICFLVAAFEVFNGVRPFVRGGFMAAFFGAWYQGPNAGAASGLPEIAAGLIVSVIVFSALYALAGWGLWKLKNCGRILTLLLLTIGSAFELLRWLLTPHFKMSAFLATLVTLALYGATIWYLLKPDVKAALPRLDRGVI